MSISRFSSLLAFTLFTTLVACGSEGPMGEMGEMGDPGTPGDKGDKGDKGDMGDPGTPGTNGTNGMNGSNGSNGTDGVSCWDSNSNGACDVAQEDRNNDTMCTPADCQGSQGPQGEPGPAGATAGQMANSAFGTAAVTSTPAASPAIAAVPGLSIPVTVPSGATFVAFASSDGGVACNGTAADDYCIVDVFVAVDGVVLTNGGYQTLIAENTANFVGIRHWSFSVTVPLAAGNHTIQIGTFPTTDLAASAATVSGPSGNILQGTLNVMLLKL